MKVRATIAVVSLLGLAAVSLVTGSGCQEDDQEEDVVLLEDTGGADVSAADAGEGPDGSGGDGGAGDASTVDGGGDGGADSGSDTDAPRWSFPDEKVACEENTNYEEQIPVLKGGKNNPTGRGEQAAIYEPCNDRIILFAGNDLAPAECSFSGSKNYLKDTWAYSREYDNWYKIKTDSAPPPRGRHASAFDASRKRMLIFGGRYRPAGQSSGGYTLYNDLWAFDINTDTWVELEDSGQVPSARTNTAMVYDDLNDRVILFGGNTSTSGLRFTPHNDTYVLDLDSHEWLRVDTGTKPPARLFHAMVMDGANNQVLMYSGGDAGAFTGPFLEDVWALDLESLEWKQVWRKTNEQAEAPEARINGEFIELRESGKVVMFAGHDDTSLGNDNDLWTFDGKTHEWSKLRQGDVYTGAGCPSFCQCSENFVEYDLESPERRQYHTFVRVTGEREALLFGGTGDCGYMDDTWKLSLQDGMWTELHPAEQGIACERTGRENCEELCF